MAFVARLFISLSLLLWVGCGAPKRSLTTPASMVPPIPSRIEVIPTAAGQLIYGSKSVDPQKGQKAHWIFIPGQTGNLQYRLYDECGKTVYASSLPVKAEDSLHMDWAGIDSSGHPVWADAFYLRLELTTAKDTLIYDPRWSTGGVPVNTEQVLTQLSDSGRFQVDFTLATAARININFGLLGGVMLHRPEWLKVYGPGKHRYMWRGKNNPDSLDFGLFRNMVHTINGYSLPENALIVLGETSPDFRNLAAETPPLARLLKPIAEQARHPLSDMAPPRFSLHIKNPIGNTAEGLPEISGKVQVQIVMEDAERFRISRQRFELMISNDFFGIFEDEEASLPFTFDWDVTGYNPGIHYLTCNIVTYSEAVGSRTLAVSIAKPKVFK